MTETKQPVACTVSKLFARLRPPSVEEQYLAQAVDANDLQVRLMALERGHA